MKEYVVPSLAEPVGMVWRELQEKYTKHGQFVVSSPLSSTPLPIYQWIVDRADSFTRWDKFQFLLMDEQVEEDKKHYISIDDPASYEGFARRRFLEPLGERVKLSSDVLFKPTLENVEYFHTSIDLLILALGVKGNYANVMPNTSIKYGWHIAHLLPEFRQVHTKAGSKSYEGARFREYGMSLGPQQVLQAKHVVVIVSGENKRELVRELKSINTFRPEFPLSIIYHPDVRNNVDMYITPDAL